MAVCKIFYSWQSDLPNSTNRGLIEQALENAAKNIHRDESIEIEPVIDRDTLNVPGSPNIAETIFRKISNSQILVCDVSLISPPDSPSRAPNPNVLIELGYAVAALTSERIIMVLNTAFGSPEELPFDLKMNRVLTYNMPESNPERALVRKTLEQSLENALRAILAKTDKSVSISEGERYRIRVLLSQEIAYDVTYLADIHRAVQAEQTKHKETFRTDGAGGWSSDGNPITALKRFHPDALSRAAWDSQMHLGPSALSQQELEAVFSFYGDLRGVAAAQENFLRLLNSKSDSPLRLNILGTHLEEVMNRVDSVLKNYPRLQ